MNRDYLADVDRVAGKRWAKIPLVLFCWMFVFELPCAANGPAAREEGNVHPKAGAKVEFDAVSFNFGTIKQGESVSHDFVFKNIGDGVLEINDVEAGCGCTSVGNWSRRVEPGMSGVIPIRFASDGLGGRVQRSVTVLSNDPRQPKLTLQLGGDVWTPFTVAPAQAMFVASRESPAETSKKVRISSRLAEPVALLGLEGADANFRARLNVLVPGREFEVEITAVPPFSATASTRFTISTSSAEAPTISVIARVIVQ